jgi:hypothetical protein
LLVGSNFSSEAKFVIIQILGEMDGDVDAAIEYMVAERFTMGASDAEGDPYTDHALGKPVPGS